MTPPISQRPAVPPLHRVGDRVHVDIDRVNRPGVVAAVIATGRLRPLYRCRVRLDDGREITCPELALGAPDPLPPAIRLVVDNARPAREPTP